MSKFIFPKNDMNLHLFDGGAAVAGGSDGGATSGGTSDSTNTAADTQAATGRSANGTNTNSQAADANRQDIAVTSPDDERRAQFETYIKGEGKQFFDERVQKIINQRFKETKSMEKSLKSINPIVKTLSDLYGVKDGDYEALNQAVLNDQRFYEERAQKNGVTVEMQMQFDRLQRENDQLKEDQAEDERQRRNQEILNDWHSQAEALKAEFPEFDFNEQLANQDFYDLIVRGTPLEAAYFAVNARNMMSKMARQTEKRVTDNIRARGMRPSENSVSSNATATTSFDVSKLTPSQMREYINRAAKGETITFRN